VKNENCTWQWYLKGKTCKAGKIYSLIIKSNRVQEPKCGGKQVTLVAGIHYRWFVLSLLAKAMVVSHMPVIKGEWSILSYVPHANWKYGLLKCLSLQYKLSKNTSRLNNPPTFTISGSWLWNICIDQSSTINARYVTCLRFGLFLRFLCFALVKHCNYIVFVIRLMCMDSIATTWCWHWLRPVFIKFHLFCPFFG